MLAQLGSIRFEGLLGFRSFEQTFESSYAEHALIDGKPRLQRTGSKLSEVSFTMGLHSMFCSPEAEIRALEVARETGDALPLITGAGFFVGRFVIKKFVVTQNKTNAFGEIISAGVSVEIKESAEPVAEGFDDGFAVISSAPLIIAPLLARAGAPVALSEDLVATVTNAAQVDENMRQANANASSRPLRLRDTLERLRTMRDGLDRITSRINDAGNIASRLIDFVGNVQRTKRAVESLESFAQINDFESALRANRDLQSSVFQMSSTGSVITQYVATRRPI